MAGTEGKYSNPFTATLTGIVNLFRQQKNIVQLDESFSMEGRTVLITGASSGLGFETAVQLAKHGAQVWMACRSGIPEKGEEVKKLSGNHHIQMIEVDLSDLDSIVSLANRLKELNVKIDVLIDNAGMVPSKSRKTRQDLEEMFVVNYLSKFLLVRLLLQNNSFNKSNGHVPRLVYVGSESHRNPKTFDWSGFGKYKSYSMGKTVEQYGYYKLLLTTFVNELSRRLNSNSEVQYSVFALCPGPVNSNIAREAPAIFKPLLKMVFTLFFSSPKRAVRPILYLASSSEVKGKSLDYLFLMGRKEMDWKAMKKENGEKLWELSETLLQKHHIILS